MGSVSPGAWNRLPRKKNTVSSVISNGKLGSRGKFIKHRRKWESWKKFQLFPFNPERFVAHPDVDVRESKLRPHSVWIREEILPRHHPGHGVVGVDSRHAISSLRVVSSSRGEIPGFGQDGRVRHYYTESEHPSSPRRSSPEPWTVHGMIVHSNGSLDCCCAFRFHLSRIESIFILSIPLSFLDAATGCSVVESGSLQGLLVYIWIQTINIEEYAV